MSNTLISDNASLLLPDSVTVKRSDPVYMAHAYPHEKSRYRRSPRSSKHSLDRVKPCSTRSLALG